MKHVSVRMSSRSGTTLRGRRLNRSQTCHESFGRCSAKISAAAVVVASCILATIQLDAADANLPLSAPVKVLPASSGDATPAGMPVQAAMLRPRPQPTTPGGKLPQYQLGHHHRTIPTAAELRDARLRLILALPAMPVLIEATIMIDGEPYLMARERRIQEILAEAARPAPVVTEETVATDLVSDAAVTTVGDSTAENDGSSSKAESTDPADLKNQTDADVTAASEDEPDPQENSEPEAEPVTPPSVPAYELPATVAERIRRFVAATGEAATADEVRWLLTNWVDGPVLLMLNDNFQRFRANQRPVFNVLDSNRDGTISPDELANAVVAFEKCDFNRNDIIEYTELAKVGSASLWRTSEHAGPGKLIFRIPDEQSAVATYRRIAARYSPEQPGVDPILPRFDVNANGQFDIEELAILHEANPDLSFTISFNTADPSASRIEVTAAGSAQAAVSTSEGVAADSISLPIGGTTVTFSAVQSGKSDQISIGAVNDGYPILPVIDPNEDGRFTMRERRELVDRLRTFDRNQDGSLSIDETQATIRICFGLGPHVHRELIALRQVNPKSEASVVAGPEWFVRMDRNRDNDISRQEFPGTAEQFADLDADGDALVSAQEAIDFDSRTEKPTSDTKPPEVESTEKPTDETATETGN